jgi:flagella basal body P-ring formation protein FlgA
MLHLLALAAALTGPVPAALERSVQERMGEVRVSVIGVTGGERYEGTKVRACEGAGAKLRASDGTGAGVRRCEALVANPEPGSRLGRPMRFILVEGGVRVGSVVAKLDVTGSAVRASRALSRGEDIGADAIEAVNVELKDMLLGRLPTMNEIVGAHARRDIRTGEVLTGAAVIVPPLVKSGDEVRVSLRTGSIEVTGVGRASGSGHVGELIRVLVPSSRRGLNARITGPGAVEIVR